MKISRANFKNINLKNSIVHAKPLKEVTPYEGQIINEKATLIKLEALNKIISEVALFASH